MKRAGLVPVVLLLSGAALAQAAMAQRTYPLGPDPSGSGWVRLGGKNCSSAQAAQAGGWQATKTAPRDGTVIEIMETYGVAPWYSIYKWDSKGGPGGKGYWTDALDPTGGIDDDECAYWRPYKSTERKYVDPTHGAQHTVAYECKWRHMTYDPKTDTCKP